MAKQDKNRDHKGKFVEGHNVSVGNDGGRPTDYKEEYNDLAYKYCLLGATDAQLAEYFEVSIATIHNWKKEQPKFLDAIKKGKEQADIEIVDSLFNKAKGFTRKVEKTFKLKTTQNGIGSTEKLEKTEDEIYIPPDTTAIIFWLKNRQPDKWRDKTEVETTQGKIDLSKLTDEEKADLLKISRKLHD